MDIFEFVRSFKKYSKLSDEEILNLRELLLNNNYLTSLPESIGNLTNLQTLILFYNRLTSLPESIGNLSNLQILSLIANKLTSLPESIGDLSNLRDLWLSRNKLTSLPESIGDLSNLRELDLSNNELNDQAQDVLKTLVMTNSVIIKLATDNFDFSEELERNKRKEPAPGRTTIKAVGFY